MVASGVVDLALACAGSARIICDCALGHRRTGRHKHDVRWLGDDSDGRLCPYGAVFIFPPDLPRLFERAAFTSISYSARQPAPAQAKTIEVKAAA